MTALIIYYAAVYAIHFLLSVKRSVCPCVMALWSIFKLFVISDKKNDSGSEEGRGVERVREVYSSSRGYF